MMTWRRPTEDNPLHNGPHAPPPPYAHFRHGKPPHEHLYEACEAIITNLQELSDRLAALEAQIAASGRKE